jgi:hypothetical protein
MENEFSDKNANLKFVSIASGMQKVMEGNLNSQSNHVIGLLYFQNKKT